MKLRHLYIAALAMAFAWSCTEEPIDAPTQEPQVFFATTEEPSGTSVYADDQLRLHWNAGDRVAVFNRSTAAEEYIFNGNDGDVSGRLISLSGMPSAQGTELKSAYAVYPYEAGASVSPAGVISLAIPDTQAYDPASFARGANIMVAATDDDTMVFRNIFGMLTVKLVGDGTKVTSVALKGNNDEPLAGVATVSIAPGGEPSLVFDGTGRKTIQLDCSDGIVLSPDKYTEFRFLIPPVTFSKGFSVTISSTGGTVVRSTDKAVTVARSRMLPMDPVSGEPFRVLGTGLRSVFVTTPDGKSITSKDVWTENCKVVITDDKGKVYFRNSEVSMKGRGNTSWSMPKKPYTFKLSSKEDLIGVGAKGKRWVLLANWMDRTLLRNDVSFEIARRTRLEWTPSGEFVELFLNGTHLGNYWLGEQIKTGKGRLDADYLIEMDTYYDATWRFYSSLGYRVNQNAWGMPIGVKEPDEDEMTDDIFNTIKGLVAGVENAIYYGGDYASLMNTDSFIDWYLVHELTGNAEPNHPKSSYFYFRKGVMYAGPVWDFDWYTFIPQQSWLCIPSSIYYDQLFKDSTFKAAVKARWKELKPLLADIPDYIDRRAEQIRASEAINRGMWPNDSYDVNGDCSLSFQQAVTRMKSAVSYRLTALDTAIANL
ncbi:MAG: CotH kinase family protein [Bacteroidales bacterium]|nr:CotH kinase family protein [Bacteroidales bacterium]